MSNYTQFELFLIISRSALLLNVSSIYSIKTMELNNSIQEMYY